MTLSARDHVDLVTKCDEQLRQNWIGLVTLTYGIPVLLANRDDLCRIGSLDPKEWIAIIYPVFAAFFIYALCEAFLERRSWIGHALASDGIVKELPAPLQGRWLRSASTEGRVAADLWLAFRIIVVLLSGEYGIVEICSYGNSKSWFEGTLEGVSYLADRGWHLAWQVPLVAAMTTILFCGLLLVVSYAGRREGNTPAATADAIVQKLRIELQHGWQLTCRMIGRS
jgi:hypothetical protein